MTHKEILEALLNGDVIKRSSMICDYLYKMVDETIYYSMYFGVEEYNWKPIIDDDVFKFYGDFSIYEK